jgi:spore coat protein U-like protein
MLLAVSGAAFAGTATVNVGVSANIANNCTVGNVSAIAFTYDPIVANHSSPAVATDTIDVTCTSGAPWTLDLDNGLNNGHVTLSQNRAMNSGSNYLSYDIYSDSGHSTVWLSGSGAKMSPEREAVQRRRRRCMVRSRPPRMFRRERTTILSSRRLTSR